jgi:hypothetical protein
MAADQGAAARRGRGGRILAAALLLIVAGAALAWRAGAFSLAPSAAAGPDDPAAPATAAVTRQDIDATTPVTATLGYAGSWTVLGPGTGTLTWLPAPGRVIRQGQALYETDNGVPVVLLYGQVPAWRSLDEGETGADVSQLNHDLVTLGWAGRADIAAAGWDYFSPETAYGVEQLETRLKVTAPAASLPLGQVVFEPAALRVSHVLGSLGSLASGSVLTATSDRHVVTILLSTSQQAQVTAGDAVTVTLPDGTTTPGTVSSVGSVASETASGPTIPVQVTLARPAAAGTLNLAPVTVTITTARSSGPVLVVPVTALLARAPGAYDVEVAGAGDTRRYVPVRVGIFDDAGGLVQVTGSLTPGQRVVVAPE